MIVVLLISIRALRATGNHAPFYILQVFLASDEATESQLQASHSCVIMLSRIRRRGNNVRHGLWLQARQTSIDAVTKDYFAGCWGMGRSMTLDRGEKTSYAVFVCSEDINIQLFLAAVNFRAILHI